MKQERVDEIKNVLDGMIQDTQAAIIDNCKDAVNLQIRLRKLTGAFVRLRGEKAKAICPDCKGDGGLSDTLDCEPGMYVECERCKGSGLKDSD